MREQNLRNLSCRSHTRSRLEHDARNGWHTALRPVRIRHGAHQTPPSVAAVMTDTIRIHTQSPRPASATPHPVRNGRRGRRRYVARVPDKGPQRGAASAPRAIPARDVRARGRWPKMAGPWHAPPDAVPARAEMWPGPGSRTCRLRRRRAMIGGSRCVECSFRSVFVRRRRPVRSD